MEEVIILPTENGPVQPPAPPPMEDPLNIVSITSLLNYFCYCIS